VQQVLIVDDEALIRAYAARVLAGANYHVLQAHDGLDALALIRETDDLALVVSDIVMPGMSGVELLERLGPARPQLPVLLMSGYTTQELHARGLAAPCGVLEKPFSATQLLSAVARCLDGRRELA